MAEAQKKDDFDFEIEGYGGNDAPQQEEKVEAKAKPELDIQIEDDTPPQDRGRDPMPKEVVDELEADELEEYSDKVKTRFKQMKKVWHDERREKERALREQQEALAVAKKAIEENQRLKSRITEGEKTHIDTAKGAAELELEMAKRAYKEAHESGDADQIVEAQTKFAEANYKLQRIKDFKPPLQEPEIAVHTEPKEAPVPPPNPKMAAWQERNPWFGRDPEMTAAALGLHRKLEDTHGTGFIGSDEYWGRVDNTMRRRFPEYWGDDVQTSDGGGKPVTRTEVKPATVVAPASRSTASKKVVLKTSQLNIAKRLGLSPEQYAREFAKTLEN